MVSHNMPPGAPIRRLLLLMGVSVPVGMLFVSFLWESLNQILSTRISATRLLITVPALVVFLFLLHCMADVLRRWEGVGDIS